MSEYIELLRIEKSDFFELANKASTVEELWDSLVLSGYVRKKESIDRVEAIFKRVWSAIRTQKRIKPPKSISPNQLSEAAYSAVAFSKQFNLGLEEGIRVYCKIAAEEFKVFQLYKYPYFEDKIISYYEAYQDSLSDKFPEITEELIETYKREILIRYNIMPEISMKDKAVFVDTAKLVVKMGLNPSEHVLDRLDKLSWLGAPPNPRVFLKLEDEESFTPVVKKVSLKKGFSRYD